MKGKFSTKGINANLYSCGCNPYIDRQSTTVVLLAVLNNNDKLPVRGLFSLIHRDCQCSDCRQGDWWPSSNFMVTREVVVKLVVGWVVVVVHVVHIA